MIPVRPGHRMLRAWWLLSLGACGYPALPGRPAPTDASEPDVREPDAIATDGLADPATFCDSADPRAVGCYEFEPDLIDHSHNHLITTKLTGVVAVAGKVGMAIQLDVASAFDIADSAALDVQAVTIEAWINPAQLPTGGNHAYIVSVANQYALSVSATGGVLCTLTGGATLSTSVSAIIANAWTHVACTYDGITQAAIYINGAVSATLASNDPLHTDGTTGMTIGGLNPSDGTGRLIGLIDQLRLLNVARSPAEICADAGKTLCP